MAISSSWCSGSTRAPPTRADRPQLAAGTSVGSGGESTTANWVRARTGGPHRGPGRARSGTSVRLRPDGRGMGRSRAHPRPAATLSQSEIGARTAVHVAHGPIATLGRWQRSALPCPAGRSVPGRGGPERRGRPRPDGTGPLVRAGSVAHRDHRGASGQRRARRARSNRRSLGLRLRQVARRQRPDQIVVPTVGGSGLSTCCREPSGSWPRGGGHRGRASLISRARSRRRTA
jgi:hypothetical protein